MTERLPGPRDWIGDAPFPWPPAHSAPVGELFHGCYFLVRFTPLRTKQDKPFLRLQLQDVHGILEARVWEMADQIAAALRDGIYVGVRGRIEVFNGERQLKVEDVRQIAVAPHELEHFLPRSRRDADEMDRELAQWIASVADAPLRALLERILGPETPIGAGFRLAPAAKFNHHAYLGGLIEHTLSITTVCDALAKHYAPHIDRDLLIAGALLHDVGKVREIGAMAGFPYTDVGKLLGHIVLGMQMTADEARAVPELTEDRLMLLQHLIASHQGRFEWQSPREPRTLEAYLLHYADDLDAKMQQAIGLVSAGGRGWSAYDRSLGREMFGHWMGAETGSGSRSGSEEPPPGTGAGPGDPVPHPERRPPEKDAFPAPYPEPQPNRKPGDDRPPAAPGRGADLPGDQGGAVRGEGYGPPIGSTRPGGKVRETLQPVTPVESEEEPEEPDAPDPEGEARQPSRTLDLFD